MIHVARSIAEHIRPQLSESDEVILDEKPGGRISPVLDRRSWNAKIRKRLLFPLRLRLMQSDVLHIIDSDYLAGVPKSRLQRTVATCHDMMPFLLSGGPEKLFKGRLGLAFFRQSIANLAKCAYVGTDSTFSKECILKYTACPEDKIKVIGIGLDPDFRPLEDETEEAIRFLAANGLGKKRYILHVGSAETYKNIDTVLRVARKAIDATDSNLILLKVGGRFSDSQRALIASLKLQENLVHLTGLTQDQLVWVYNAASLLLWPSHFEGFGLPALESMGCGTPVVCSNAGSLPEVVGDAALMHDPLDVDGLTQSCLRILGDENFANSLSDAGLKQAGKFSWADTARQYYELYLRIPQENRASE